MARKEKNTKYMVYIMAFLMISSVFAVMFYGFSDQGDTISYGKFKFNKQERGWTLNTKVQTYTLDYLPQEVEVFNVSEDIANKLKGALEIDVTSKVDDKNIDNIGYAEYSIATNLPQKFIRVGFITNSSYEAPIVTCSDATSIVPVIYFVTGNETKIIEENNCIIAQSRDEFGFVRIKDRLLYAVIGVI